MSWFQWAGAIAGFAAVLLSILLNVNQLMSLFARGRCLITSTYHSAKDLVGFDSKPRFVLYFENTSSIPMDFRHFELLLPRMSGVVENGQFVAHPGARLYRDGVPLGSRFKPRQEFVKIDSLTRVVRVEPYSSEIDFFELDTFMPEGIPEGWEMDLSLPDDFKPVLQFRHAAGAEFHCDADGIHPGPYVWPYAEDYRRVRAAARPAKAAELRRGRFLRRWSAEQRDAPSEYT